MSTIFRTAPFNIDVNAYVDTLHIGKDVNRIIFCNIAERRVSLILSAPLNGFLPLEIWPGYSLLCLCEPSILRETTAQNTAFSELLIHTYSDETELRILPNAQHPTCTTFVSISFSDSPPSLRNLAKSQIRANTVQKRHGTLAFEYYRVIPHDFHLSQNLGETFTTLKISLVTPYGKFPSCIHTQCTCPMHCQKCDEKAHCCTAGGTVACTGRRLSTLSHNVLCDTLFYS